MDSRPGKKQDGNQPRSLPATSDIPPPPSGADRGSSGAGPKSIRDTATWKASQRGIKQFWTSYLTRLSESFNSMSRGEQENLIAKFCVIVTVGVTVMGFLLFYNFIPLHLRVILIPIAMVVAWWAAGKIVAPVVLDRLAGKLNRD